MIEDSNPDKESLIVVYEYTKIKRTPQTSPKREETCEETTHVRITHEKLKNNPRHSDRTNIELLMTERERSRFLQHFPQIGVSYKDSSGTFIVHQALAQYNHHRLHKASKDPTARSSVDEVLAFQRELLTPILRLEALINSRQKHANQEAQLDYLQSEAQKAIEAVKLSIQKRIRRLKQSKKESESKREDLVSDSHSRSSIGSRSNISIDPDDQNSLNKNVKNRAQLDDQITALRHLSENLDISLVAFKNQCDHINENKLLSHDILNQLYSAKHTSNVGFVGESIGEFSANILDQALSTNMHCIETIHHYSPIDLAVNVNSGLNALKFARNDIRLKYFSSFGTRFINNESPVPDTMLEVVHQARIIESTEAESTRKTWRSILPHLEGGADDDYTIRHILEFVRQGFGKTHHHNTAGELNWKKSEWWADWAFFCFVEVPFYWILFRGSCFAIAHALEIALLAARILLSVAITAVVSIISLAAHIAINTVAIGISACITFLYVILALRELTTTIRNMFDFVHAGLSTFDSALFWLTGKTDAGLNAAHVFVKMQKYLGYKESKDDVLNAMVDTSPKSGYQKMAAYFLSATSWFGKLHTIFREFCTSFWHGLFVEPWGTAKELYYKLEEGAEGLIKTRQAHVKDLAINVKKRNSDTETTNKKLKETIKALIAKHNALKKTTEEWDTHNEDAVMLKWLRNELSSFLDCPEEVFEALNELIGHAYLHDPALAVAAFTFAVSTFAVMAMPSAACNLLGKYLTAALKVIPDGIGKAFMGKGIEDGLTTQLFISIMLFKFSEFPLAALLRAVKGDLHFFHTLERYSEQIILGTLVLVGLGASFGLLPQIPTNLSPAFHSGSPIINMGYQLGVMDINFFVGCVNWLLGEANEVLHHAAWGLNTLELSFIGLKSVLLLKSMFEGVENTNHKRVLLQHIMETFKKVESCELKEDDSINQAVLGRAEIHFGNLYDKVTTKYKYNHTHRYNRKQFIELAIKAVRSQHTEASAAIENALPQILNHLNPKTIKLEKLFKVRETSSKLQEMDLFEALKLVRLMELQGGDVREHTYAQKRALYNLLVVAFEKHNRKNVRDATLDSEAFLCAYYNKYCHQGTHNGLKFLGVMLFPITWTIRLFKWSFAWFLSDNATRHSIAKEWAADGAILFQLPAVLLESFKLFFKYCTSAVLGTITTAFALVYYTATATIAIAGWVLFNLVRCLTQLLFWAVNRAWAFTKHPAWTQISAHTSFLIGYQHAESVIRFLNQSLSYVFDTTGNIFNAHIPGLSTIFQTVYGSFCQLAGTNSDSLLKQTTDMISHLKTEQAKEIKDTAACRAANKQLEPIFGGQDYEKLKFTDKQKNALRAATQEQSQLEASESSSAYKETPTTQMLKAFTAAAESRTPMPARLRCGIFSESNSQGKVADNGSLKQIVHQVFPTPFASSAA